MVVGLLVPTRDQLGISLNRLVPLDSALPIQIVHIHCVLFRFVNYQKSWTEMELN